MVERGLPKPEAAGSNPVSRSKLLLDIDKIAEGLGAERRGTVKVSGGAFGAAQAALDVYGNHNTLGEVLKELGDRIREMELSGQLCPWCLGTLEHLRDSPLYADMFRNRPVCRHPKAPIAHRAIS